VKGLLADVNNVKQVRVLLMLLQEEARVEFWNHLGLTMRTFADLGLHPHSPDVDVWRRCQSAELVLNTANRNEDGPDSLEATIRTHGTGQSLPVFALADANRVLFAAVHFRSALGPIEVVRQLDNAPLSTYACM